MQEDVILSLPCLPLPENTASSKTLRDFIKEWRSKRECQGEDEEAEATCWSNLGSYIRGVAEARIELVRTWISQNTARFLESHDVQKLHANFDVHAKLVRSQVVLCAMLCATCRRKCINLQNHVGAHDCGTQHKCTQKCDFPQDHVDQLPHCAQGALHLGVHL